MTLPRIGAEQLSDLLPMEAAIDALEAAFAAPELPRAPLRSHVETGGGELLMMPATGDQGSGVKLVTVHPDNPARGIPLIQGVYVLFAPGTLEPAAVIDGAALTAIRTAAVSGLATRHLARPDAGVLLVFGAGTQAHWHLRAMAAVRPVREVVVVARSRESGEAFAKEAEATGLAARAGTARDVASVELVCTCTTSGEPLFDGGLLATGAHVNAIGAYTPSTREVDGETVRRARIAVETREVALAEAGDLLIPLQEGVIDRDAILADLAEVVRGAPVRTSPDDITLFKSVGVAFEDLVVARAAVDRLGA